MGRIEQPEAPGIGRSFYLHFGEESDPFAVHFVRQVISTEIEF